MNPNPDPWVGVFYLGRIAQLVRAPALHAGGHRFESCFAHQLSCLLKQILIFGYKGVGRGLACIFPFFS
jgi:hypothetical protein